MSTKVQQRISTLRDACDFVSVQQMRVLTLTCTGTLDRAFPGKPARYAASPPFALTGQRGTGRHTWPELVVTFDSMASWSTMWHLQAEQEYTRGPFSHCLNGLPIYRQLCELPCLAALALCSAVTTPCRGDTAGLLVVGLSAGVYAQVLQEWKMRAEPERRHLTSTMGSLSGLWVVAS